MIYPGASLAPGDNCDLRVLPGCPGGVPQATWSRESHRAMVGPRPFSRVPVSTSLRPGWQVAGRSGQGGGAVWRRKCQAQEGGVHSPRRGGSACHVSVLSVLVSPLTLWPCLLCVPSVSLSFPLTKFLPLSLATGHFSSEHGFLALKSGAGISCLLAPPPPSQILVPSPCNLPSLRCCLLDSQEPGSLPKSSTLLGP